jgi:hypothetical protein
VLRLKTQTRVSTEDCLALSPDRIVQKIPAVELDRRFRSPYFHYPAGHGIVELGSLYRLSGYARQDKVVVITVSDTQLFVLLTDALADGG